MTKNRALTQAIEAAKQEEYLLALTLFLDVYGGTEDAPLQSAKTAAGLSWFGLSLALMQKKFKPAIDLCRRAIELEFFNADHYANLTQVYIAAGNRKKAVETLEQGLKVLPDHDRLLAVQKQVGIRARPAVPFLTRNNPINVSLGQARHAKKVAVEESRKKR